MFRIIVARTMPVFFAFAFVFGVIVNLSQAAPASAENSQTPAPATKPHLVSDKGQKPFYIFLTPHEGLFWADSIAMTTAMAHNFDADLVPLNFNDDPQRAIALLEEMAPRMKQAHGMIFDDVPGSNERVLAFCEEHEIPCININGSLPDLEFGPRSKYRNWVGEILPDHESAGAMLMERLLQGAREKGWKEIHVLGIGGLTTSPGGEMRRVGWERRLKYQPDVKTTRFTSADWTAETAARAFREALQANPALNVIWAANDDMALGVVEEAKRLAPEREFLIGGIDWSIKALQQIVDGNMHYSVGGHLFEGALALALLHDFNKGRDFLSEGLSFRTRMTPMSIDIIHDYMEFRQIPLDKLSLHRLSKVKNEILEFYPFNIQDLLKLLTSEPAKGFQIELTEEERAWLAQNHTVRVRIRDWPPLMFEEPESSGMAVDYLNAAARMAGFQVRFIPDTVGWPESLRDLIEDRERYDLILTMKRTPEREAQIAVTDDYLFFPWVIIARNDGAFIGGMDDLDGKIIAVERGYVMQQKLLSEYPETKQLETETSLDALQAVADGRATAYIGNLANATYLIQEHRLDKLKIAAPTPFDNHNQAMGVRQDWPELASIINKAIAAIPQSKHDTIRNRWLALHFEVGLQPREVGLWIGAILLVTLIIFYWNRHLAQEITSRKRSEVALTEAKKSVEAALLREKEYNLLQQKFISLVSHEFRTPLAIIDGVAQRLIKRKDKLTPDEVETRTNKVRSAVTRMVGLIDTTLYASRLDAGQIKLKLAPCDVGELVRKVCERQTDISPSHKIQVEIDAFPNEIFADKERLDQVFTNLLSNAVKYAPDAPLIEVKHWGDGGDVWVSVTDHGLGIPEDDLPHMFKRFFRAETAKGIPGTGIGLNVVKEFVEMHGGTITVDSVEGEGSTFTVRLPIGGRDQ